MAGISTLGAALRQIELISAQQSQFDTLATQLTTGKKTQSFAGLGNDVLLSQRARADFSSLDNFINNITRADTRINLTLDAIEEFISQTENLMDALIQLPNAASLQEGEIVYYDDPLTPDVDEHIPLGQTSGDPAVELEIVQDISNNLFEFVADLLNIKDGDRYLLHGSETLTQPYNNNGVLDAAISTLLSDWRGGTITTTDLIADLQGRDATTNPDALTDTIVGYSAQLSSGSTQPLFVRVSEASEVDYTALANDVGFRDVLVALSYLRSPDLGPVVDVYIPPNAPPAAPDQQGVPGADINEQKDNFFEVVEALTGMVSNALDNLDSLRFELEAARAQINQTKEAHIDSKAVLLSTISDVEDIDQNEVALQLNTLQIQLDASFRVIARVRELSLTNFI